MSKCQNIYDNEQFYRGYKELRENENNYNVLQEKPAIRSLLPNLKNKSILDLGCGYGENCRYFIKEGAKEVIGVDISENMLKTALKENTDSRIKYLRIDINDISTINKKFDIVYSSLAFHYIEDLKQLLFNIGNLLNKDGMLIFSQEHPLTTAYKKGERWAKSNTGEYLHYNLSHYMENGERRITWFVDNVIKYHRSFSTIVNNICETGFQIEKMIEPMPSEEDIRLLPKMVKDIHKPNFLIIRASL